MKLYGPQIRAHGSWILSNKKVPASTIDIPLPFTQPQEIIEGALKDEKK